MATQTATLSKEASDEPKPQPIDLLSTSAARTYNHIHPALILGIFYTSFSSVVDDPVASLTYLLIPLAGLQAAFCSICVPASSQPKVTTATQAPNTRSSQGPRKKKTSSWQSDAAGKLIPAVLSTILAFFVTSPPLFIIAVLHGAPVTTHIPHTILLAAHISLLSCVPLFYAHGVDSYRWRMLYSLQAPVDELMGATIGTVMGAWLGAIPIPLDWDREWQKWPVTVVTGAYLGWAVGRTLGGWSKARGTYINFD